MFRFKNKIRHKKCELCNQNIYYYGKEISHEPNLVYIPEEFEYQINCNWCGLEYYVVAKKENMNKFEENRLKARFKM